MAGKLVRFVEMNLVTAIGGMVTGNKICKRGSQDVTFFRIFRNT